MDAPTFKLSSEVRLHSKQTLLYLEDAPEGQPSFEDGAANIGLGEYLFLEVVHTISPGRTN
jgi:hypothetical protein